VSLLLEPAPSCADRPTSSAPSASGGAVVAVMQPYIFPYLGYLGLLASADVFVFYDDVQYIPRGWINRNRLLVQGAAHTFTVPVVKASQNKRIDEVKLHDFAGFRRRFLRQLDGAYRRAPHFEATRAWVDGLLSEAPPGLAELAMRTVRASAERLGLTVQFRRASESFADTRGWPRAERLMAITRACGARRYVNAPGGAVLYTPAEFAAGGVELRFVQPLLTPYPQHGAGAFVPGLSVIDALMACTPAEVGRLARQVVLTGAEA
jgi:hypothetical protein